jgi:hypothetical protein
VVCFGRESWSALWRARFAALAAACACSGGGLPCASSVAAYCASAQQPVCNWSDYAKPANCPYTSLNTSCSPYDVAIQHGVDTGVTSYYQRTTGELVAAVSYTTFGRSCIAGPQGSGFSEPDCPSSGFSPNCPDAGP